MGRLICISGPDGVGKTTQINFLIENYKKENIIFEYKWLRFYHLFSLFVLALARLMKLSETIQIGKNEKIGYHYFEKSHLISFLYTITLYLDTLLLTFFKVYIPLNLFQKNLACDRFIYDTLIDLMISTGNYDIYKKKIGKLFLRLMPHRNETIFLIANVNTLKARREDVKFDKNIKLKNRLYQEIAIHLNIPVINADMDRTDINRQIMRILNE